MLWRSLFIQPHQKWQRIAQSGLPPSGQTRPVAQSNIGLEAGRKSTTDARPASGLTVSGSFATGEGKRPKAPKQQQTACRQRHR